MAIKITVIRYELWGNAQDGFDCNNVYTLGSENVLDDSDLVLTMLAHDYFLGRSFALAQDEIESVTAEHLELSDIDSFEPYLAEILYRGTPIGALKRGDNNE